MDTRHFTNDQSAECEPLDTAMIDFAKSLNKEIDPELEPIFSSGIWVLDGMVSNNRSGDKLMGAVNIGNRIFTDDTVTLLKNGKYKISPKGDFFAGNNARLSFIMNLSADNAQKNNSLAKAVIDGKQYEAKEIFIDKKDVYIDGFKMTGEKEIASLML